MAHLTSASAISQRLLLHRRALAVVVMLRKVQFQEIEEIVPLEVQIISKTASLRH